MSPRLSYGSPPVAVCLAVILVSTARCPAQDNPQAAETSITGEQGAEAVEPAADGKSKPFDLWTAKHLTGDWGGGRTDLEDAGVSFKITLMNQLMVNMYGGKETKNGHDTAGSYEFNLYLDLEKMKLVPGAEFWIRAKGTWGGDDSDFDKEKVGGLFKTNQDASSEEPIFIDKWHWKQKLFDDKLEFRVGRMAPVKDFFDTSKVIGHEDKYFMNQALVRNATIPAGKGLGLFVNWEFTDHAYLKMAALDAHAKDRQTNFNTAFHDEDEFRFFGEIGGNPQFDSAKGKLRGNYRVGTWYDPTRKQVYLNTLGGLRADRRESGDWGFFVGFEQMVWKENNDSKDRQGVTVAGRYGYAPGRVNKIEHFWAAAAQYEGLIPGRDQDLLGIGVAQGILADEYRQVRAQADRETVYELYYSIHVAPWLIISPDFQYITNTGGDKDGPDTAVAGLRVNLSL